MFKSDKLESERFETTADRDQSLCSHLNVHLSMYNVDIETGPRIYLRAGKTIYRDNFLVFLYGVCITCYFMDLCYI